MAGGFRELENITADLGIEAWGATLEEAFASTANGLADLLSDLPGSDDHPQSRSIRIRAGSLDSLLVQFLNEIVYLEETQGFLPGEVAHLKIHDNSLKAEVTGALYDPEVHTVHAHVKAATYHGLQIRNKEDEVRIRVIFDV